MKTAPLPVAPAKLRRPKSSSPRPRMTRRLAEDRAVGDVKSPKFDGTAFLRSLRP